MLTNKVSFFGFRNCFNVSSLISNYNFLLLNFLSYKMDRLENDLRFFLRELESENDPFRRRLVQQRIVATQRAILALMTAEREELDRQNTNMERALELIRAREENKRKWLCWQLILYVNKWSYISYCLSKLSYKVKFKISESPEVVF